MCNTCYTPSQDTFNISRDLWEKRIRDQSDTVRKLQDKVNQLEGVIAKKKKQKGLTKEEEQILQLPQVNNVQYINMVQCIKKVTLITFNL